MSQSRRRKIKRLRYKITIQKNLSCTVFTRQFKTWLGDNNKSLTLRSTIGGGGGRKSPPVILRAALLAANVEGCFTAKA
jgi:hypothetical protein